MLGILAAIDCGTSVIKAGLFDTNGQLLSLISRALPCRHHPDGRVEQDAGKIRASAFSCLKKAIADSGIKPSRIAALTITNHRASLEPYFHLWKNFAAGAGEPVVVQIREPVHAAAGFPPPVLRRLRMGV